jgi:hypothetical protein
MSRTKLLKVCAVVASATLVVGSAWAADAKLATPTPDVLTVDYFANANTSGAPDATVRLVNPGTTYSNLCADVFVFDANEEMSECCSCTITPDGPLTLSVNGDLTSNPLTGVILSNGVIKVVSDHTTRAGTCPLPASNINPTPTLRGWTTHIQNSSFTITETASQEANLSAGEVRALENQCNAIKVDGSGHGICANSAALSGICNN